MDKSKRIISNKAIMNVFAFSLMLKKENLENSGVLVEMFSLNHLDFFIGPISLIRTGPTTRAVTGLMQVRYAALPSTTRDESTAQY